MANPKKGETWLVEEVPGVPEEDAYYIWEHGERGKLWNGATAEAGREWAKANGVTIDFEEMGY